jgi:diguanylate cyclase (GGDEF)-like protein
LPAPRFRSIVDRSLTGALGAVSGGATLAATGTLPTTWRAAAVAAAALAGAAGAAWAQRRAAARRWAERHVPEEPVRTPRRRPRATPATGERDVLAELLAEVRDAVGADAAIFWRVAPDGGGLVAHSAAGGEGAVTLPDDASTREVIAWSAHERVAQYAAPSGAVLGAAPVTSRGALLGALSVHAAEPLPGAPEAIKARLLRHALQLGDVADLLDTRAAYEAEHRHAQQLLAAAHEFQRLRTPAELAAGLCEAAQAVTNLPRAALVRWSEPDAAGRVVHVAADRGFGNPSLVSSESLVGAACREGLPRLWADAGQLDAGPPLFGPTDAQRTIQSLAIVPIQGRTGVLGAVVLEGVAPDAVCARDLRTVRLLAALAAVSIETLDGFEAAERRAFTDELTGVTNRRGFEAQLAAALDRSDRFGESVAVVMCDVDEFKALNDAHGHEAGDLVLRSVAATLKRGVRAVDCCARYGGEEFVLVLPQATGAGAAELAERLRRAIEMRPVRADGRQLRVSASFGVAVYPTPVTTRGDLVAAADRALYRAKRDGRNCVRSE